MTAQPNPQADPLKILIGISGGIACYKIAPLVSRLAQDGHDVTVVMTDAATRFITPLTFETLSGNPAYTSLWQKGEYNFAQHIELARWADRVLLAPATANIIAKVTHGICDDLLSTILCAVPQDTPRYAAPAMNADMLANPAVQQNIQTLSTTLGYQLIGPDSGWQACRTSGAGRMSEPDTLYDTITR